MLFVYFIIAFVTLVVLVESNLPIRAWVERREADRVAAIQQNNMSNLGRQNLLMNSVLSNLLHEIPSASRVRIGTIRSQLSGPDHQMLFDINNGIAAPGHPLGNMSVGLPLTRWNDFLPKLLDRKCSFIKVQDLSDFNDQNAHTTIHELGIDAFAACGIFGSKGDLLGATFVSWDDIQDVPVKDMDQVFRIMTVTSALIANIMKTNL